MVCLLCSVLTWQSLNIRKAQCSRKGFCSTELLSAFRAALWICRCLTICPVRLRISFCFVFPFSLFLLQLSERARERKVPVTRIGRLANFGGQFAHPHLQSHYACLYWLIAGCDSALAEALVGFIFWLSLLIGKFFPTNSWLAGTYCVKRQLNIFSNIIRWCLSNVLPPKLSKDLTYSREKGNYHSIAGAHS